MARFGRSFPGVHKFTKVYGYPLTNLAGDFPTTVTLAGQPFVIQFVSGTFATNVALSSTPPTVIVPLSGSFGITSTLGGGPTAVVPLSGTFTITSALSTTPPTPVSPLSGTFPMTVTLGGHPITTQPLTGSLPITMTLGGGPTTVVPLSGTFATTVTLGGGPTTVVPLSGSFPITVTLRGTPGVPIPLSGSFPMTVTLGGFPGVPVALSGTFGTTVALSTTPPSVYTGMTPDYTYGSDIYYGFPQAGPPILAPTSCAASPVTAQSITVTWTNPANADRLLLERSTDNVNWTQIVNLAAPIATWTDTNLNVFTAYYYRVRAANAYAQFSAYSNIASATTLTPKLTGTMVWTSTFNAPVAVYTSAAFIYYYDNVGIQPTQFTGTGGGGERVNQRSDGVNGQAPVIKPQGVGILQRSARA